MSEPDPGPPADASQYGTWRAQQYRAYLQERRAATPAAEVKAHGFVSGQLRASRAGPVPGHVAHDLGAAVAGQQATVGADFDGAGGGRRRAGRRPDRWSAVSDSPAPAMVELRPRRPGMRPAGVSPLAAHMRGQQGKH